MAARAVLHDADQGDGDAHEPAASSKAATPATSSTTPAATSRESRRRAAHRSGSPQTGHEELVGYGTVTPYRYWNGISTPIERHRSAETRPLGDRLLCHRYPCGEIGGAVGLRSVHHPRRFEWRSGPAVSEWPTRQRARVQHAASGEGVPQRRSRDLCPGLLAHRPSDGELRARLEYFNGQITAQSSPAGRFVPARELSRKSSACRAGPT